MVSALQITKSNFWIFVCLVASTSCLLLYFREVERISLSAGRGSPVGTVVYARNDVQRRPQDRLLWLSLKEQRQVYDRDVIRTGEESTIFLELQGGKSHLRLSPNSLVVLENDSDGIEIRLASGDLFLKGKLNAKIGERYIQSPGAEVLIEKNTEDGRLGIQVKEGEVEVLKPDGQSEVLESGTQFIEKASGEQTRESLPVSFLWPQPWDSLTFEDEKTPIPIEWTIKEGSSQTRFRLERSKDENFPKNETFSQEIDKSNSLNLHGLGEGLWHVRMVDPQTEHQLSPTLAFQIHRAQNPVIDESADSGKMSAVEEKMRNALQTMPQIIYPAEGSRFLLRNSHDLSLEWTFSTVGTSAPESFEIHLENLGGNSVDIREKVSGDRWKIPKLPPGQYKVSVQPFWKSHGAGLESAGREFTVLRGAGPEAPVLRKPSGD